MNDNRKEPRPKPSFRAGSNFLPGDIVQFGFADILNIRGADKSLARPGRKQATATKL